ncbi:MAG: hypothetical protein JW708_02100 [Vallitaleaceae bacterium]|nr:hypothetical protein [Vallitaleaceae bacterium]
MGALKFGILGLLILCPLFYVSYMDQQILKERERYTKYIQESIEEATYDAAFAIKEYSRKEYNAEEIYRIQIPYEVVVEVFFQSFHQREIVYSKKDFPAILFIETDGIVSYLPKYQVFLPKRFYGDPNQEQEILQCIEEELLSLQKEGFLSKEYNFILPSYGNESYGKVISDLCLLSIYENTHVLQGETLRFFDILPAGVLKKEISY